MDLANAVFVVLAVLVSLVLADLILMMVFVLMDLADPARVRSGWSTLVAWFYEASDLWSHARRSKG